MLPYVSGPHEQHPLGEAPACTRVRRGQRLQQLPASASLLQAPVGLWEGVHKLGLTMSAPAADPCPQHNVEGEVQPTAPQPDPDSSTSGRLTRSLSISCPRPQPTLGVSKCNATEAQQQFPLPHATSHAHRDVGNRATEATGACHSAAFGPRAQLQGGEAAAEHVRCSMAAWREGFLPTFPLQGFTTQFRAGNKQALSRCLPSTACSL